MGMLDQPLRKPVRLFNIRTRESEQFTRSSTLRDVMRAHLPDCIMQARLDTLRETDDPDTLESYNAAWRRADEETARAVALIDRRDRGERLEVQDKAFLQEVIRPVLDELIGQEKSHRTLVDLQSQDLDAYARHCKLMDEAPGFMGDHHGEADEAVLDSRMEAMEITPDDQEDAQAELVSIKLHKQRMISLLEAMRDAVDGPQRALG